MRAKALLLTMLVCGGTAWAAVPAGNTDLTQPQPPQMTGTVEERNAAIDKMLRGAGDQGRISEISFSDIDVEMAATYLGRQTKIDIAVDKEALAKEGVEVGSVSLLLYEVSFRQVLETIRWETAVKDGAVAWKADGGMLKLLKMPEAAHATETEADKKLDEAQRKLLQEKTKETTPTEATAETALHFLSMQARVNIIVDWASIKRAGADLRGNVTLKLGDVTTGEALESILASIKLKDGKVGYEIWGGLVHVSTRERLDKEMPKAEAGGGLP